MDDLILGRKLDFVESGKLFLDRRFQGVPPDPSLGGIGPEIYHIGIMGCNLGKQIYILCFKCLDHLINDRLSLSFLDRESTLG